MMRGVMTAAAVLTAALGVGAVRASDADGLAAGFRNPPPSARPQTWWHWMNGNVTKEGITADLEAMKEIGLGGATIFDVGCWIPPGKLKYNSPEWFETVEHAAKEARRLGIELCLPNCSGWSSSGGPWNPPENGMKMLAWTEKRVQGGAEVSEKLDPLPNPCGFSKDLAVLAIPLTPAELEDEASGMIVTAPTGNVQTVSFPKSRTVTGFSFRLAYGWVWHVPGEVTAEASEDGLDYRKLGTFPADLARRAGCDYLDRYFPFPDETRGRFFRFTFKFEDSSVLGGNVKLADLRVGRRVRLERHSDRIFAKRGDNLRKLKPAAADQYVARDAVLDVTDRLGADGVLRWRAPAGEWRVVRLGYYADGRKNKPASDHGEGLEVDKLSAKALDFHFDQYAAKLARFPAITGLLVDSYEVGAQNWTQAFPEEFRRRRGYDLKPYLPVFSGVLVDSAETTERFLADFRLTISELFCENYSGALARRCRESGFQLWLEPYGNCPCDDFEYGDNVDVPMCEFWSWSNRGDFVTDVGNARTVAHLAHVWGRRFCAAEAFTANPGAGAGRWRTMPKTIKAQGDRAFAEGVNRLVFHRFCHQPFTKPTRYPGFTMGHWGMHLDRTQTWWHLGRPWMDYLARCQWMLQEGIFAADVLFWHGGEAPSVGGHIDGYPKPLPGHAVPSGFAKDVCSTRAMKALKVEAGSVGVPGGSRYAFLVVEDEASMRPDAKAALGELRRAGARVYKSAAEGIAALKLQPDFVCTQAPESVRGKVAWIHRKYKDGREAYFVAAPNEAACEIVCSFRIGAGRVPEIWDPETGDVGRGPKAWKRVGDRTEVTLAFPPAGSVIVVFRPGTETHGATRSEKVQRSRSLAGQTWRVSFPVDWHKGGTNVKTVVMKDLRDWTVFDDPDIKYFSGTATYETAVEWKDGEVELDLGNVKEFAEVFVNDRKVATLWKPPYRVRSQNPVTPTSQTFLLRIRVTNLWPNRLVGDDRLFPEDCEWENGPAKKGYKCMPVHVVPDWVWAGKPSPTGRGTFTTWKHWSKDDDLLPSGLLGPVTLNDLEEESAR